MIESVRRAALLAGLAAGCLAALATVGLAFMPPAIIPLLLPGLILSIGGPHFPSLPFWVCPIGNLTFWFLLFWLLGLLIGKALRPGTRSRAS